MSVLQPIYHSLASGRHLNKVIISLLLIAVIFDGYALVAAALAVCRWARRSLRKAEQTPQLKQNAQTHSVIG